VSLPIDWKELARLKAGNVFKIRDALNRRKDPWADIAAAGRQTLPLDQLK
jgi:DNA primase